MYLGIAILRVPQGLDYSNIIEDNDTPILSNGTAAPEVPTPNVVENEEVNRNQSASQLSQGKFGIFLNN